MDNSQRRALPPRLTSFIPRIASGPTLQARLMNAILDLLSPPCCALCSRTIPTKGLCEHCAESLPRRFWTPSAKTTHVDQILCLGDYALTPGRLVRLAKYGRREDVAQIVARSLAEACGPQTQGSDVVVPVPQHWQKNLSRGFSPVEITARAVANKLQRPLSKSHRRGRGKRLASVPSHQRSTIAASQFSARKLHPRACILLVDDVYTTGATASACARILKTGGAKEVRLLVAASPLI